MQAHNIWIKLYVFGAFNPKTPTMLFLFCVYLIN